MAIKDRCMLRWSLVQVGLYVFMGEKKHHIWRYTHNNKCNHYSTYFGQEVVSAFVSLHLVLHISLPEIVAHPLSSNLL